MYQSSLLYIQLMNLVKDNNTFSAITLDMIENAGKSDLSYSNLLKWTEKGFPNSKHKCDPDIKSYWEKRHSLSTYGSVVVMDNRLVIPQSLRKTILHALHAAHQGCDGMLARASNTVYWPQIRQAILNFRASCKSCHVNAPSLPKEPYVPSKPAEYPFQKVCADYCVYNQRPFLIITDRFSGWIHIYGVSNSATSRSLIKHCRKLFTDYGTPEVFESDGGPQFIATDFEDFLKVWGVYHRKSSAHYPQSNGRAELGVKSAKKILRDTVGPGGTIDNDRFSRAILQYRNTPIQGFGVSPAQLLFCRDLRDFVPSHPQHYRLNNKWIELADKREAMLSDRNNRIAKLYNKHAHSLKPLQLGIPVLVQNKHDKRHMNKWNLSGRIVEILPHRQYKVRLDGSGRVSLRNRKHIKPVPNQFSGLASLPHLKSPTPKLHAESDTTPDAEAADHGNTNADTLPYYERPVPTPAESSASSSQERRLQNALKKLASYNTPGTTEQLPLPPRRRRYNHP